MDVIGDWWSLPIIQDALDGVRRFSDFQSGLGIAKGMLAARLRDLVGRGILKTEPAANGSAYREYVLTDLGRGLFLVIVALRQWGEALYRPDERRSMLVDTAWGAPVEPLVLLSKDGRALVGPLQTGAVRPSSSDTACAANVLAASAAALLASENSGTPGVAR